MWLLITDSTGVPVAIDEVLWLGGCRLQDGLSVGEGTTHPQLQQEDWLKTDGVLDSCVLEIK